jgi:hypothetical protein
MALFWEVAPCSLVDTNRLSEKLTISIIMSILEAGSSSKTSVNIYQIAGSNIPEGISLHNRQIGKLKNHQTHNS